MSWKDDLTKVIEQNEKMLHMMAIIQGQGVLNSKRIEALKVIIDAQIKGAGRSADRMGDRLIEMAMVRQGRPVEAAAHRRSLDEVQDQEGSDPWADDPESQWPPPGCDAVNIP